MPIKRALFVVCPTNVCSERTYKKYCIRVNLNTNFNNRYVNFSFILRVQVPISSKNLNNNSQYNPSSFGLCEELSRNDSNCLTIVYDTESRSTK